MQDPVQAAHKEMVHPGAMGIANGLMISASKKVKKMKNYLGKLTMMP